MEVSLASLYSQHRIYKLTERACAIVAPLTVEAFALYSGDSDDIVFRPLTPVIEFGVVKITPGHRPASIIASSSSNLVTTELTRIGAKQIT